MNANLNPQTEKDWNEADRFWRDRYAQESYHDPELPYGEYQSAYRAGYEGYGRYPGQTYEQAEAQLESDWEGGKGDVAIAWHKARHAVKAAWQRAERAVSDHTGRDRR